MKFWFLNSYSDFLTDQTFHQFHDPDTALDFQRNTSGFHWTFAMGLACQQGMLTPPDSWFRPLLGACICSDCWDQFSWLYTDLMTVPSLTFTELRAVLMEYKFCDACGMQSGSAYHSEHLVPSPLGYLLILQLLRPVFPYLPCLFFDFSPCILLGTFSILLIRAHIVRRSTF